MQWIDAAPVSALTFNDDVRLIDIQPGAQPGDKAVIVPETEGSYYEFDNRIVTTAAGVTRKVGIHREPGSNKVLLWGWIPVGDAGMKEAWPWMIPRHTRHSFFARCWNGAAYKYRGNARVARRRGAVF